MWGYQLYRQKEINSEAKWERERKFKEKWERKKKVFFEKMIIIPLTTDW